MRLTFTLNGERREVDGIWPGESLLHVLRERVGAPGSKNACEQGECGSCSIYLDDTLVCSCLVAAGQTEGRSVRTVEGLSASITNVAGNHTARSATAVTATAANLLDTATRERGGIPAGELHPVQQAFIDAGAVQCGFCTPGLIMATDDLLARNPSPSVPEVREALAGNLCRCTGYEKILDAVAVAAARMRGDEEHVIVPKVVPGFAPPPVGGFGAKS
ncbi:MAG: (2Fe-2S)-binding protein [Thermoleophilia bacterium]|nr:(2Fe-2S)-binding protein [Thermoleophilia bacterium]